MSYRIGIDVGGTNTDVVLIDEHMNVISKYKSATTNDIMKGIQESIHFIINDSGVEKQLITLAILGKTQNTNDIVERPNLNHVGVIRIEYPATTADPRLYDLSEEILKEIGQHQ